MALSTVECENILQAWGAFRRREIRDEVGYRPVAVGFDGYSSPEEWGEHPSPPVVSHGDVERACWVWHALTINGHRRLHRDALDHYRDGMRMAWQRLETIRTEFTRVWQTWEFVNEPTNAV